MDGSISWTGSVSCNHGRDRYTYIVEGSRDGVFSYGNKSLYGAMAIIKSEDG
jgi:hypothetical protein